MPQLPRIVKLWKKHQFKIIVFVCVIIILILYFLNDEKEGTWSTEYSYNPFTKQLRFTRESKGERECRRILERIFMRPFPNQRPSFLLNPATNKPLEIDCCNIDIMLGVEYNGIQHYQFVPKMHKTIQDFHAQQKRDNLKLKLCKDYGFNLIVIPYFIPIESIERYLVEELKRYGYL